ncbi:hypothetical protein F5888DRAFT_715965 [Russula emetica]|nr:hypothetical protein F5888DRAFT_715965 [Russula emetica]
MADPCLSLTLYYCNHWKLKLKHGQIDLAHPPGPLQEKSEGQLSTSHCKGLVDINLVLVYTLPFSPIRTRTASLPHHWSTCMPVLWNRILIIEMQTQEKNPGRDSMVRLITYLTFLHVTCNDFPLKLTNVKLALREADFNPDFLRGIVASFPGSNGMRLSRHPAR